MTLYIFDSTHDALAAERILLQNDYKLRIIPTPRQFSESCGLSIRVETTAWQEIKKLLIENGLIDLKICEVINSDNKIEYQEINE